MPYSHQDNIQELVANGVIPLDDTFDYVNHDPYGIVEQYFQFCQTNLSEECAEYNIQPARLYIRKKMEVNARAGKVNDHYYVIAINFGTLPTMFRFYTDNRKIFQGEVLQEYSHLHQTLDISLDYLLFQVSVQFTYYHELAHLIQKSPITQHWIEEMYEAIQDGNNGFNLDRNVYEMDADLHASHYVAFHLLDYWKRQNDQLRTGDNLTLLLSLGAAGILIYFLFLMQNYVAIYYRASTHPHPLVRISYIVDAFIKVAEANLPDKIQIDSKNVVRRAFQIADALFKNEGKNIVGDFAYIHQQESANILEYVNGTLLPRSKEMNDLVMNRHQ